MRRLAVVAAVALVFSACGGGEDTGAGVASLSETPDSTAVAAGENPGTEESTSPAETDGEAALLAFTACMRENGVDMDDPVMDADGNLRLSRPRGAGEGGEFDRDSVEAARAACGEHLEGVTLGRRGDDRTEIEDTLLAYATCMRGEGIDFPDPDFSAAGPQGGGPGGGPFGAIDRTDPAFQAADEVCRSVFGGLDGPFRGPGPGGGAGAPGGGDS